MKTLLSTVVLFVFSLAAYAGPGHSHDHGHSHGPITEKKVIAKAMKKLTFLVNKGTVAKSWESATLAKAEKKVFGKKTEWVVSFTNNGAKDASKSTLYFFYTLKGHYLAANYTGK